MTARFSVQVPRFVVPVPGQIVLDAQGMLATHGLFGVPEGDLVEVAALASAGSFCMLGEPGAGKTTALQAIVRDLPDPADAAPGQHAALMVSLAEITDRAAFRELVTRPVLFRSPRALASQSTPGEQTTLVLDGLDECRMPGTAKTLASLLRDMLKDVDTSLLRVLVGCRTADYPELIGGVLGQALPSFEVYELAPLSRQHVHDLAASRGSDPEAFLSAVAGTGTGPLASLPLTLDLLLRQYAEVGGLHGGATEMYESALRALADEPDPDRARGQRTPGSGEQHLAVAARLCCYLLLCGRAAFWTGATGSVSSGDLEPFSLAGGEEEQTGGAFAVTHDLVDATLRGALFTSRGPGRLGPAHATFGAYLAARHLAAHHLSEPQLRSVLTIRSDSGSTGIPANLRETAAWLVALRPEQTGWLADVEPASLAAHAAVIDDAKIRSLIVERLLAEPRAALAGGWHPGWQLAHPGLAGQLADALAPLADPAIPQLPRELSYLALSLARIAEPAAIMTTLLAIATRPDAEPEFRALAIDSAAHMDRASAAPGLAGVLREITLHPERDPSDDIRGALLEATWPETLPVTDLISALTRPRRDDYLGRYVSFRDRLPRRLSDEDVPHLLRWALAGSATADSVPEGTRAVATLPFHDDEFVRTLLDRALACRNLDLILEPAATLIATQLRAYRDLEVPAVLDERDADGVEADSSRDLRRSLAVALLAQHEEGDHAGQLIMWGWQPSRIAETRHKDAVQQGKAGYPHARRGLLDSTDLSWALEQANADAQQRAEIYLPLLRALYDPGDVLAQEAASEVEGTPFWPAFAYWFDPIALGSEEAAQTRQAFELSQPRRHSWEEAPRHAARVLDLYRRATTQTSAFWQLLYNLQVDPGTGRGLHTHSDDVTTRPGVKLLPEGWLEHLHEAAWNYLHESPPPDDEFLDRPELTSWPAEAGYLALALLSRHEVSGRTVDVLDGGSLAKWAASILAFPAVPVNAGDTGLKRVLLARLAQAAPDELPDLVDRVLTGHLTLGRRPSELALIDAAYTHAIGDVLARRLPDVITALQGTLARASAAPDPPPPASSDMQDLERERQLSDQRLAALRDTIDLLIRILARCRHTAGIELARSTIVEAAAPHAEQATVQAGRIAATALLARDATHWADILDRVTNAPDLARLVFQDLARDWADSQLLRNLTEAQLTDLWNLLVQHWPYHPDRGWRVGAHFVGPDEQAQHWRDAVLNELVQRGTSQAVRLLRQLAATQPALPWLHDRIRAAQELEMGQSWAPPSPEQLTQLLTERRSRVVRDSADLADLIVTALEVSANRLSRIGQLLWNSFSSNGQERWRPKSEPDVGAWLSEQLTIELARSGVVVNREVLVRQTTTRGHGLAVDVQADAPVTSGKQAEPARCRIELKGNWNRDLMTAMRSQLADDYLLPEGLRDGIYVTAWFDAALWNDESDPQRAAAAARDRDDTEQELAAQAEALRQLGLRVRSVIIDVPRPTPSKRSRSSRPAPGRE